ncbi:protoporphyrinogen oxidase [Streptomyces sp. ODS28]|uniref:protoporphyrinogen oxidase n=1 Tax=Streptomyces sp. ODS28 TaxID=3136688 RepID=UPI0031EAFB6D
MRVIVVGGGIAGLAAAERLVRDGAEVTLLEAAPRCGGKLLTGEVAGAAVDLGAEAMLARRPEGVDLARDAGLGDALTAPEPVGAAIWSRGDLVPMPKGHVMGVPGDPAALETLLSAEGLQRIAADAELPPTEVGEDVAIGEYVAERLGPEVVDRLVEPLLGGVYAGDAYKISMRAAVPQLYEAARAHTSLLEGVREIQARSQGTSGGPVFAGIEGGIGRLPGAVAETLRAAGADIRTGTPAKGLRRFPEGWQVSVDGGVLTADAVVLAVPAFPAAKLLAAEAPAAAWVLEDMEYASMALVTLAFRRSELGDRVPGGSGFLVPPVDGRNIKAATFSANKWRWSAAQDPSLFLLRASLGRYGDEAVLEREDSELVELALQDLESATGLTHGRTAAPVDAVVTRWDDALPQYPAGHLERVERVRRYAAQVPGLAVCGAAYGGVGIPACVADGRRAAEAVTGRTLQRAGQKSE